VLALLPVGQRGLGVAQRVLADAVFLAQLFQPWLGVEDRFLQHLQARLVALDVFADLGKRGLGLVAGALQALGHLALVRDLLFDAGEIAADFVACGLRLVQRFHGLFAAHAAGLDPGLGLALFGDQLLQAGFLLRQALAQRGELPVQRAVFERLPLGVAALPLGLDLGVLLGLPGLPRQVLQLLADLVAQVGQAVEVFAGVADAGLGFLAPLLVLGDAGGLLQVHAQFLGPGLDDLADHALLDDRVAARAQARAEEQVGDVAPPALAAVEVVGALAVARNRALDRDLVERRVLAADGVV